MTEHVWKRQSDGRYWRGDGERMLAECLTNEQVEARLNATERLSAKMARQSVAAHEMLYSTPLGQPETQDGQDAYNELVDALAAYANILEGKDE